jgi:hypothetical protein
MRFFLRKLVPIFFILVTSGPASAIGEGYSGGGSDSGCCGSDGGDGGVPIELGKSAAALRKAFRSIDRQELLDQQILGIICEKQNCGELVEEQAKQLLDRFFREQDRVQDEIDKDTSRKFDWIGALSGIAGALLAAVGIYISWRAHKESIAAERQSARNEVEISHLKDRTSGA